MKESEFKDILSRINTDTTMDQQIVDNLINYEASSNHTFQAKWLSNLNTTKNDKKLLSKISKSIAAVVLLAILGTTTALAASYLKSYTAEFEVVPETELGPPADTLVRKEFGEGHKNETKTTYDSAGNVIEFIGPEDPNHDDVKYGNEAFAEIGLPNLIPTYLYDNYLLEEGGYIYVEQLRQDGFIMKKISAGFYQGDSGKYVFVDFLPSDQSSNYGIIAYLDSELSTKDFITSTYINKGGLTCNLVENSKHGIVSSTILFDSETLGNATYGISFTNIKMDEIEAILDSIPINVTE